jgi:hypothetical protein
MKNGNEIDRVREWFIENDLPYFAVHTTKVDRVWWNNTIDEMDEAAAKLDKFLNRNEPGTYTLYVFDKKNSKEPTGTLKFRFLPALENSGYDNQEEFYRNKYPVQTMLLEQMKELTAEVKLMKERAELLDESDDEDDVKEESQPANIIGAIVGHPAVQNLLMNFLTNITANMVTSNTAQPVHNVRPQAMAGTEGGESEYNFILPNSKILDALFSKGVTWNDLKILSDMPEDKIKSLLSMLRVL